MALNSNVLNSVQYFIFVILTICLAHHAIFQLYIRYSLSGTIDTRECKNDNQRNAIVRMSMRTGEVAV